MRAEVCEREIFIFPENYYLVYDYTVIDGQYFIFVILSKIMRRLLLWCLSEYKFNIHHKSQYYYSILMSRARICMQQRGFFATSKQCFSE